MTRAQLRRGHEVQVLTTDQGESRGEHPAKFDDRVDIVKRAMLGPDTAGFAPAFRATARRLFQENDVLHVHSLFNYPTEIACRTARKLGKPFIVRPCGVLHPNGLAYRSFKKWVFLKLFASSGFRRAAAIHCATYREADLSRTQFAPAPSFVVPNGLDPEDFEAFNPNTLDSEVRREFQLPDRPYALFLGRIHPIKGLETMLPGFAAGAPAECDLVLAGPEDRPYGQKIRNLVERLGLDDRTHFVGPVYGRRKVMLLAAARLFALASLYESFGNVIVESLAAGTPVLLSDRIDLCHAVTAAGVGWAVPPTTEAWSEAFGIHLGADRWHDLQRKHARKWALENYSWDHLAATLDEHYQRYCLGEPHAIKTRGDA